MIVVANSLPGLIKAYLALTQREQVYARRPEPPPAPVAPPGGGTALPEVTEDGRRQPSQVVSPISGALARQAYQTEAMAAQRAQLIG